jgi:hypothetical protein
MERSVVRRECVGALLRLMMRKDSILTPFPPSDVDAATLNKVAR